MPNDPRGFAYPDPSGIVIELAGKQLCAIRALMHSTQVHRNLDGQYTSSGWRSPAQRPSATRPRSPPFPRSHAAAVAPAMQRKQNAESLPPVEAGAKPSTQEQSQRHARASLMALRLLARYPATKVRMTAYQDAGTIVTALCRTLAASLPASDLER